MSGLTGTFQKLLGKKVIIRDVSKGTTVGVVKKVVSRCWAGIKNTAPLDAGTMIYPLILELENLQQMWVGLIWIGQIVGESPTL